MHVTISHYYNPQPPVQSFQRGSRNQAIKGTVDMDESRQPKGECRRRQEGLNLLFPSGSWLVHIPQPTTCTEQPLNHNAYSNQANAQESICSSTYFAQSLHSVSTVLWKDCLRLKIALNIFNAVITVYFIYRLPKTCFFKVLALSLTQKKQGHCDNIIILNIPLIRPFSIPLNL